MVLITSPVSLPDEARIIQRLFEEGLELLHIRKPNASRDEVVNFISGIDEQYHPRLVLHQDYELADVFSINRIHFTEKTRLDFKEITGNLDKQKSWVFSTSTHSIETFNMLPDQFTYAFLSPVYESISKSGYIPETNIAESVKKRTNFKTDLIALGGISSENQEQALVNGFNDVALLGAIWNAENPIEEFKKCLTICNEHRK